MFLDREDLETPYDRSRAGELADQIWGRRLYILTEDLRRRKKMVSRLYECIIANNWFS